MIVGPLVGTTRAGGRPRGVDGGGSLGDHRLLPVRLAQGLGVKAEPARELGQDLRDPLLHLHVEHELAAGEARNDLRGQVVSRGTEPAARHDEVHPQIGQESQAALEVGPPIADADDVRDLDSELAQPLGDPGTVAVGDPAGEHLRARDHDAAANGPLP